MIGLEVQDTGGLPAPLLRDRIVDLAFHRGLLLLPCGASTVRFCPPLCLTAHQVDIGLQLFAAALSEAQSELEPSATVVAHETAINIRGWSHRAG